MVDTPKRNDDEEQRDATRDRSLKKHSKRGRKRRTKLHLDRDPATEQGEPADDEHAIEQPSEQGNLDKQTEQPVPGEDNSPDDLTPDKLLEQKNLHKRLVATARSLKSRSGGSKQRKMHSELDGAKYSTPQTNTATVATKRAIQSENYCRNLIRRP